MIRAGIIGATGYAGAELARLLLPVSYTHLDVYKRQPAPLWRGNNGNDSGNSAG